MTDSQKGSMWSLIIVVAATILAVIVVGINYPGNEKREITPTSVPIPPINQALIGEYQGTLLAGVSAPLLDFNQTDYDQARQSGKLVVLYFYANWCPICRAEFPVMQKVFNGLTTDQVVGFRVNFKDNETEAKETELAREFGVAYQHTKVFIKNGERVLKSPEGWDENRYLSEIGRFLNQ
ncbi:MAG: thioredoxin family protein [Patescibacteria group bacterium]